MRRLLHRPFDLEPDSRHARWQASGVRCVQLDDDNLCKLFGTPQRPAVCRDFDFDHELCGDSREEALRLIGEWERLT